MAGTETVTFQRAPQLRDEQNSLTPQRDWGNATTTAIDGCTVQPVSTQDLYDAAGVGIVDVLRVYGPRGVDIDVQAGDRALWAGTPYEVHGEPQRWKRSGGTIHHVEILIRKQPATPVDATGTPAVLRTAAQGLAEGQKVWTP
jgi:hypothetical protein